MSEETRINPAVSNATEINPALSGSQTTVNPALSAAAVISPGTELPGGYVIKQRLSAPAGEAAPRAARYPTPDDEARDCYFFVTDLTGKYYYGRTLSEHNANCQKARDVNRSLR